MSPNGTRSFRSIHIDENAVFCQDLTRYLPLFVACLDSDSWPTNGWGLCSGIQNRKRRVCAVNPLAVRTHTVNGRRPMPFLSSCNSCAGILSTVCPQSTDRRIGADIDGRKFHPFDAGESKRQFSRENLLVIGCTVLTCHVASLAFRTFSRMVAPILAGRSLWLVELPASSFPAQGSCDVARHGSTWRIMRLVLYSVCDWNHRYRRLVLGRKISLTGGARSPGFRVGLAVALHPVERGSRRTEHERHPAS